MATPPLDYTSQYKRPGPPRPVKKPRPKRTGMDYFLMSFAALVIIGTIAGVSYIMMSHSASRHALHKAQMRPLKYPTRTSLVKAAGNDLVWAYNTGGAYIILTDEELNDDINRSTLLQVVIAPYESNPGALPGSKLYTASGLEGLRVIDLEKAGRLNTAEIITALCTGGSADATICRGYASQRVTKLREKLNRVLHHAFYAHLEDGDAAVMSFSGGRASFYQHYTPATDDGESIIKVGRHRISQVECRGCFEG